MSKICHIVQSYYPRDPRIRRQAEALVEAGFEVDVICLRGPGEKSRETVKGVQVLRVPLSRQRGGVLRYVFEYGAFFLMASAVAAVRARRYRVIHVSNMPDFLIFSALIPKLFGTTVMLDEHDLFPELFVAKYGFSPEHRIIKFLRWQEKHSLRFPHHILTTTTPFQEHYEKIVPRAHISVVMNLPDDRLFHPPSPQGEKPAERDDFVMIYAGTISHIYSLDLVIRAIANLTDRIPNIRFVLLGEGDDMPRLRELASELGIADRVDFVGEVPFASVPDYIVHSDIGISTLKLDPLTDKCFNNKAGEYVAMGLPTISTRTTAVAGHFPEGVLRLVEPGSQESLEQAILDLHSDPELRDRMSRDGLIFSAKANWSTEKLKYVELMKTLSDRH